MSFYKSTRKSNNSNLKDGQKIYKQVMKAETQMYSKHKDVFNTTIKPIKAKTFFNISC